MVRQIYPPTDDTAVPEVAPTPAGDDRAALLCSAKGCPNRWSTLSDRGVKLCGAHAVAPPRMWPLVTSAQCRSRDEVRALVRAAPQAAGMPTTAPDEVRKLRDRLAAAPPLPPRAWAAELRAREAAGSNRVNKTSRAAWRETLGWPAKAGATDESWREEPTP